jgi:hypothetical protein
MSLPHPASEPAPASPVHDDHDQTHDQLSSSPTAAAVVDSVSESADVIPQAAIGSSATHPSVGDSSGVNDQGLAVDSEDTFQILSTTEPIIDSEPSSKKPLAVNTLDVDHGTPSNQASPESQTLTGSPAVSTNVQLEAAQPGPVPNSEPADSESINRQTLALTVTQSVTSDSPTLSIAFPPADDQRSPAADVEKANVEPVEQDLVEHSDVDTSISNVNQLEVTAREPHDQELPVEPAGTKLTSQTQSGHGTGVASSGRRSGDLSRTPAISEVRCLSVFFSKRV